MYSRRFRFVPAPRRRSEEQQRLRSPQRGRPVAGDAAPRKRIGAQQTTNQEIACQDLRSRCSAQCAWLRLRVPAASVQFQSDPRTWGPQERSNGLDTIPSIRLRRVKNGEAEAGLWPLRGHQPWISNCSGCSAGSLFTRMFLPTRSSNSVSHRALLDLRIFTVSGFTRRTTSELSKCFRIFRNST